MKESPHEPSDGMVRQLSRLVGQAKGGDPLASLTIVAPSEHAAVSLRQALSARQPLVNVTFTTTQGLVALLGHLDQQAAGDVGLEMEREASRLAARSVPRFSSVADRPAALDTIHRLHRRLLLCEAGALELLASQRGVTQDLVSVFDRTRERIDQAGFGDIGHHLAAAERAVAERAAAERAAAEDPAPGPALGPVLAVEALEAARREQRLLSSLGSRRLSTAGATGATAPAVLECSDPHEEVRTVVRLVVEAARDGVPLSNQAVLHPGLVRYARMIHQELAAAGIPSVGTRSASLGDSGPARLLTGLLRAAKDGWRRDSVGRFLGAAPISEWAGGPIVPSSCWDQLSSQAGIVQGADQWRERLENLAQSRSAGTNDPRRGARWTATDEKMLDRFRRFMDELLLGHGPPDVADWRTWTQWGRDVLERYVSARPDPTETSNASGYNASGYNAPGHVEETTENLLRALDHLERLDDLSASQVTIEVFHQSLTSATERVAYPSSATMATAVYVGPISEASGLCLTHTYLVGLADQFFPGTLGDDSLIPDHLRVAIADSILPSRAERLRMRRHAFEVCLGAADRVVLVQPRHDPRTGRQLTPCRWITGDPLTTCLPSFASSVVSGPAANLSELRLQRIAGQTEAGIAAEQSDPAIAEPSLHLGLACTKARESAEFTRFDGYLPQGDDTLGAARVRAFDPERPVSATRFETYASCPRRFLFERALSLALPERPEELFTIKGAERGTLVHQILESYVSERLAGSPPSLDRLRAIARKCCGEAERRGVTGVPFLWRVEQHRLWRLLQGFFADDRLLPVAAELPFGQRPSVPTSGKGDWQQDRHDTKSAGAPTVTVELEGAAVSFQGWIDRVDRDDQERLVVSDYKTGQEASLASSLLNDPVGRGTHLQLPLYALAAQQALEGVALAEAMLARPEGNSPVHARFWVLGDGTSRAIGGLVDEVVLARFRQVIGQIAQGIESGAFPGIPGEEERRPGSFTNCRYCDFNDLCPRTRDRQWQAKKRHPAVSQVVLLTEGTLEPELANRFVSTAVDLASP